MTERERQILYLTSRFSDLLKASQSLIVVDTDDKRICVSVGYWEDEVKDFFLMEIGSDDSHYRFELWLDGANTGTYVEFAFESETDLKG